MIGNSHGRIDKISRISSVKIRSVIVKFRSSSNIIIRNGAN